MLVRHAVNLAQLPLRHLGGGTIPGARGVWGRASMRNMTIGDGMPSKFAGIPHAAYSPTSWRLPYTGGAIASRVGPTITFTPSAAINEGRSISGTTTVTFSANAPLNLVVSGSGTASLVFSGSGNIVAAAPASGTASITISGTGAITAAGLLAGAANITFTHSGAISAVGYMTGLSSPHTTPVLTEEGIADAVWAKVLP